MFRTSVRRDDVDVPVLVDVDETNRRFVELEGVLDCPREAGRGNESALTVATKYVEVFPRLVLSRDDQIERTVGVRVAKSDRSRLIAELEQAVRRGWEFASAVAQANLHQSPQEVLRDQIHVSVAVDVS